MDQSDLHIYYIGVDFIIQPEAFTPLITKDWSLRNPGELQEVRTLAINELLDKYKEKNVFKETIDISGFLKLNYFHEYHS